MGTPTGNDEQAGRPTARFRIGRERPRDSDRVEAFSDAVMAIAMTLMAVELLQVPGGGPEESLASALRHEWPAYLAYFVSFLLIGQVWVTHHNMWRYVERTDQMLLFFNLMLLLFVAVVPFAAALLAEHLQGSASEKRLTAGIYVGVVLGEALFFNLSWWWASRRGLLHPGMHSDLVRAVAHRYAIGPVLYLVAFSFVFVNAVVSLTLYLLLVFFYIFPGPGDLPSTGRGPS